MARLISVQELRKVLKELRPDDQLFVNAVGNLGILRNDHYFGFIDFEAGTLELSPEGSENDPK